MTDLTIAQRAALRFAEETARDLEARARERLAHVLAGAGRLVEPFDNAMASVREHARVVVHFHPDRLGYGHITVAESLLEGGFYRNQFETGLSSGSRSAFAGGSRDRWERELFGGAYHVPGVTPEERPKYGALELIRFPDGPIPRFGSCYFVLHPAVSTRSTFTFGGSERALAIERFGTAGRLDAVMAAVLEEVAAGARATVPWPPYSAPTLGVPDLTIPGLVDRLVNSLPNERGDPSQRPPGRVLDTCIEAHVHGPIDLRRDVECLVVDPAFRGTTTGSVLAELARTYQIESYWHCGFRLRPGEIPDDFRGPAMRPLGQHIAREGILDAAAIGAAERSLHLHAQEWHDWGSRDELLQHLKQLWHVLVRYGEPDLPWPRSVAET